MATWETEVIVRLMHSFHSLNECSMNDISPISLVIVAAYVY